MKARTPVLTLAVDDLGRGERRLSPAGERSVLPASALRPYVDRIWTNEITAPTQIDVVPDGCIDIYWSGTGLSVAGPNTNIVTVGVPSAATMTGVRFRPGIAGNWLGVPALEFVNIHALLEDVWSRPAIECITDKLAAARSASSIAAVLEHWLVERLPEVAPIDPRIGAIVSAAMRERRGSERIVSVLVDELGWSERTLRRRCEEAFGYGAKTLERILRFQRFLRLVQDHRSLLSVLALEAGYADQAHLAREVRKLAGRSPRELLSALEM